MVIKKDARSRRFRWVLHFQEFDLKIEEKNGCENLVIDHLSHLEQPQITEERHINQIFHMSRFLGSNMRNKNKTSCYANYVKFVTNDIVPLNYDIIIPRNKKNTQNIPKIFTLKCYKTN